MVNEMVKFTTFDFRSDVIQHHLIASANYLIVLSAQQLFQ